jgi:hypothetical protein
LCATRDKVIHMQSQLLAKFSVVFWLFCVPSFEIGTLQFEDPKTSVLWLSVAQRELAYLVFLYFFDNPADPFFGDVRDYWEILPSRRLRQLHQNKGSVPIILFIQI